MAGLKLWWWLQLATVQVWLKGDHCELIKSEFYFTQKQSDEGIFFHVTCIPWFFCSVHLGSCWGYCAKCEDSALLPGADSAPAPERLPLYSQVFVSLCKYNKTLLIWSSCSIFAKQWTAWQGEKVSWCHWFFILKWRQNQNERNTRSSMLPVIQTAAMHGFAAWHGC